MTRRPTVGISYRFLPHYRIAFFSALRTALCGEGIDLELCYGVDAGADLTPPATLDWARPVHNRTIALGNGPPLVWQPITPAVRRADLVVLMQESRCSATFR